MGEVDRTFDCEQRELPDDELVLAIIAGEADYDALRRRTPGRIAAARMFAGVAQTRFAGGAGGSGCDLCGMPGSQATMEWNARFLGSDVFVKSLLLFPLVLVTIMLGGILPDVQANVTCVRFRTRHVLCDKCRPGLAKRFVVGLLNVSVGLLTLAAFGIFLFSAGALICYRLGVWDIERELAIAVIPWFICSLLFMLSHLWRWPRKVARAIVLPPGLRGIASGPFEPCLDRAAE